MKREKIIEYSKQGIAMRRLVEKKPRYKGSFKQGDSLIDLLKWKDNIGILTGKVSGIVCVDIDRHMNNKGEVIDGVVELKDFLINHDLKLPKTRTIKSPNDGLHYYYKLPPEYFETKFYPNIELIKGVDFRNHGQFMVGEDSIVTDDNDKKQVYKVVNDVPFNEIPVVPDWLLQVYKKPVRDKNDPNQRMTFIANKMTYWTEGAGEGNRNNWLTAQVGFLTGQNMAENEVMQWAEILNENFIKPPLEQSEIVAMVESITNSEKYKKKGEEND